VLAERGVGPWGATLRATWAKEAAMKIAIDAGHGMGNRRRGRYAPGACRTHDGKQYQEADFALAYALSLNYFCKEAEIPRFLTRATKDHHCPVWRRRILAENADCTHFISFHVNAASSFARGTETLCRDPDKDLPFAQDIQDAVRGALGFRNRGIKDRDDLAVLKFDGPAALVELGFINNYDEITYLARRATRILVATAIVRVLEGLNAVG
jgi:N-acetylmuramoyl-L-alanine amidase